MPDEHENPWTTLRSRVVYENDWLRLREDEVLRPDGAPGIYGVVEPRAAATGVVALTPAREVVLVGQFRYTLQRYSWELPEGGTHPGETPLQAAQRELQEEAGLVAARWRPLGGELHLSNSISAEVGYLFLAEELTDVPPAPDGTEQLALRRAPLTAALEEVLTGRIQDAMSVMGILLAARELGV